jgi:hypothetical protein
MKRKRRCQWDAGRCHGKAVAKVNGAKTCAVHFALFRLAVRMEEATV